MLPCLSRVIEYVTVDLLQAPSQRVADRIAVSIASLRETATSACEDCIVTAIAWQQPILRRRLSGKILFVFFRTANALSPLSPKSHSHCNARALTEFGAAAPPVVRSKRHGAGPLIMTRPGRSSRTRRRLDAGRFRPLSVRATRNPLLLFRFPVVFLLRFAERRFLGLLFQEPPRNTGQGAGQAPGDGSNHPP